tara:strand:+ start:618 stop:1055 length:438 start_codon:yes stop_codon:yes gene_type:complete
MTQKRELTDKQQSFIQEYVRSGDAVEATRFAGYSHSTLGSLRAEASRLKRKLSSEIADELRFNMLRSAPKAIEMLKDLMFNAKSEAVRARCAMDLLDRAGFKSVKQLEVQAPPRSSEEIEAELVSLIGKESTDLLLGRLNKKMVN